MNHISPKPLDFMLGVSIASVIDMWEFSKEIFIELL